MEIYQNIPEPEQEKNLILATKIIEELWDIHKKRDEMYISLDYWQNVDSIINQSPISEHLTIADIYKNIMLFRDEIQALNYIITSPTFPALEFYVRGNDFERQRIIISITELFRYENPNFSIPRRRNSNINFEKEFETLYHQLFRNNNTEGRFSLSQVPIEKAIQEFKGRAIDFLITRIKSIKEYILGMGSHNNISILESLNRPGGGKIPAPGCDFVVSTNTDDLRVFWSGDYLISSHYFNHPTTPVRKVLHTGNYLFGVDGGQYGNVIHWDRNARVTLPGDSSVHLNF